MVRAVTAGLAGTIQAAGLLYGVTAARGGEPAELTARPAPGELVFVTFTPQHPGASRIQVARPGGRARTIFSADRGIDFPRWSPDGKKIVFSSTGADGRYSNLYIVNADGTGLRQITFGRRHFDQTPAWSPDRKKIAFASSAGPVGAAHIWVKNLATGALTQLTSGTATSWEPTWSPDGRTIAFASNRTGAFNIWTMNLATRRWRQATFGPGDNEFPAWSPTGRRIAFASRRAKEWDIWVKNLATGTVTRLTRSNSTALDPTWSPDGGWIAFDSDPRLAFFNIFIKSVRTGRLVRVTNNAPAGSDSIEPDWTLR